MSTNQFTPEQEQWLQELESGKHTQCREKLFSPEKNAYCCLGVAARFVLHIEPEIVSNFAMFNSVTITCPNHTLLHLFGDSGDVGGGCMEDFWQAIQKAGHPCFCQPSLAGYNDTGATFAQIAAAIRAVPWAIFTNFTKPSNNSVQL